MMRASIYSMGAFFAGIAPTAVTCQSTEIYSYLKDVFNVYKRENKNLYKITKVEKIVKSACKSVIKSYNTPIPTNHIKKVGNGRVKR
jgi:hypothetical protein